MFWTLDEAKQKQCMMSGGSGHCLAEGCMGFRLELIYDQRLQGLVPKGFCGYAGKPEKMCAWPEKFARPTMAGKVTA